MLLCRDPLRDLPANENMLRQSFFQLGPNLPRHVAAGKEHYLGKKRLHSRTVTNDGHMSEEATNRGAVGELLRHIRSRFAAKPSDDVASSVCLFEWHGRLSKVQPQRGLPTEPCLWHNHWHHLHVKEACALGWGISPR